MADSLRFVRLNEDGSVPTSGSSGGSDVNITEIAGASVTTAGLPVLSGFSIAPYDYVANVSASTTDTYTFKTGGAGGTTVATITLTFTDSTKAVLSTAVKT